MTTNEQHTIINDDPNIEMHQQKPLSDEDIDAMYEQHLNDNNNQ